MANDVADWTSQVVIQSGSVTIVGTATVTISGTPTVQFAPGQSVSISGTPTVTISGTVSVSISGTPTVILGAGTASVGSISAIGSTVTVAGTINIGNTPSVSISGTPTVNIAAGQSVSITGTVSVSISSGSVSISGTANINILTQSITVATNQIATALADLSFPINATSTRTTAAVPAGTHALILINDSAGGNRLTNLSVFGSTTGARYLPSEGNQSNINFPPAQLIAIPIISASDSTYAVIGTNGAGNPVTVHVIALLDAEATWVQNSRRTPVYSKTEAIEYDFLVFNAPAAGSAATVTVAGQATLNNIVGMLAASLEQSAATATGVDTVIVDSTPTTYFDQILGTTAAIGSASHYELPGIAIKILVSSLVTFKFTAGVAGANQRVNMGTYFT